ncbi:hypothetical protein G6F68_012751 [Rhizopus microsporus]|nr:hypothetical protein G6F68_012751 [Rhizopus microsporus]
MHFHVGIVQVRQQPLQAQAVGTRTRIEQGHLATAVVGHAQRVQQFLLRTTGADRHAGAGVDGAMHQRLQDRRRQRHRGGGQRWPATTGNRPAGCAGRPPLRPDRAAGAGVHPAPARCGPAARCTAPAAVPAPPAARHLRPATAPRRRCRHPAVPSQPSAPAAGTGTGALRTGWRSRCTARDGRSTAPAAAGAAPTETRGGSPGGSYNTLRNAPCGAVGTRCARWP